MNQPRIVLGQLLGFITGHCYLKRHQAIIDAQMAEIMEIDIDDEAAPDKWCDFCGGGEQTPEHILSYCDKFVALRLEVFGVPFLTQPYEIDIANLILFLKRAEIESLEMYDTFKQYKEGMGIDS